MGPWPAPALPPSSAPSTAGGLGRFCSGTASCVSIAGGPAIELPRCEGLISDCSSGYNSPKKVGIVRSRLEDTDCELDEAPASF